MKIGYLRVSTEEQRPDRQIDALTPICDALHVEKLSATAKSRPVYERVINTLNAGDIFVIWDLDRAYRSAKDALNELDRLRERGIEIQIASINIDTSTPHGMLIYTFISGLAEFERRLLSERTKQGLAAARKRGVKLGPPQKMTEAQVRAAIRKISMKEASVAEIAALNGVHPSTVARSIKRLTSNENV
ncbi:recombinase family protein [Sulfitobacter mediterraneus]|uniref:recombinase family protein n=1 Tax=Sulfitobacter mediterraneus TaxID=83219 RepID=UPI001939780C|nr:recombinase family protein [Sulfitobacter mediterraneus]MBM1556232.1 recombinase family protein [Sulfitobacter mediterraneus]MBM1567730.1 recombinase family protein [Sulfitobacter mediterraneus]MBM1571586.1 recombinase family protein [Sulfitobacter mediterraneus]MBM1575374.1 recombinase family protein [Sulfitobacter mediterraneus]MBM1579135.1 recombinase family protein [Sulfitobacter mediterraneus]